MIPYKGIFPMDIKIQNGKILSTGTHISEKKAKIIDLEGKYVAPGIVDPHVHLGLFTPFDTEIVTETISDPEHGGGYELFVQDGATHPIKR